MCRNKNISVAKAKEYGRMRRLHQGELHGFKPYPLLSTAPENIDKLGEGVALYFVYMKLFLRSYAIMSVFALGMCLINAEANTAAAVITSVGLTPNPNSRSDWLFLVSLGNIRAAGREPDIVLGLLDFGMVLVFLFLLRSLPSSLADWNARKRRPPAVGLRPASLAPAPAPALPPWSTPSAYTVLLTSLPARIEVGELSRRLLQMCGAEQGQGQGAGAGAGQERQGLVSLCAIVSQGCQNMSHSADLRLGSVTRGGGRGGSGGGGVGGRAQGPHCVIAEWNHRRVPAAAPAGGSGGRVRLKWFPIKAGVAEGDILARCCCCFSSRGRKGAGHAGVGAKADKEDREREAMAKLPFEELHRQFGANISRVKQRQPSPPGAPAVHVAAADGGAAGALLGLRGVEGQAHGEGEGQEEEEEDEGEPLLGQPQNVLLNPIAVYATFTHQHLASECLAAAKGCRWWPLFAFARCPARSCFRQCVMRASRPGEPSDIVWRNLALSTFAKRICRKSVALIITIALVASNFIALYNLQMFKFAHPHFTKREAAFFGVTIVLIGEAVKFALRLNVLFELHFTKSGQETTIAQTKFLVECTNNILIILLLFGCPDTTTSADWYSSAGFIVLGILAADAVIPNLIQLLHPKTRLLRALVACRPRSSQCNLNAAYARPRLELWSRFVALLGSHFIAFWFAAAVPLCIPLAALNMALSYSTEKFNLLRQYSRPAMLDPSMAAFVRHALPVSIFLHSLFAILAFRHAAYENTFHMKRWFKWTLADFLPLHITWAQVPEILLLGIGALWSAVHWAMACSSYTCGWSGALAQRYPPVEALGNKRGGKHGGWQHSRTRSASHAASLQRGMESYTLFAEAALRGRDRHGAAAAGAGNSDNNSSGFPVESESVSSLFSTCECGGCESTSRQPRALEASCGPCSAV